jgi:hypothetical protein
VVFGGSSAQVPWRKHDSHEHGRQDIKEGWCRQIGGGWRTDAMEGEGGGCRLVDGRSSQQERRPVGTA